MFPAFVGGFAGRGEGGAGGRAGFCVISKLCGGFFLCKKVKNIGFFVGEGGGRGGQGQAHEHFCECCLGWGGAGSWSGGG